MDPPPRMTSPPNKTLVVPLSLFWAALMVELHAIVDLCFFFYVLGHVIILNSGSSSWIP
uniref:Transmembrane protein n=1 Tax=Manihot esculenta TaxID=3983 RepID=A0A251IP43_MANES